jgi:hypothetical protein
MVDDDNVLDSEYLARSHRIASIHQNLGAFGGSVVGRFESEPPKWFSEFEFDLIGVRPLHSDHWSNSLWDWMSMPIGAGMVVRRPFA